jgi:threonine/homoserine/homoserine lactone efflux protein
MLRIPFLFNPVGWVLLGGAGYLLYKAGKKAGESEKEEQNKPESSKKPVVTKTPATA